MKNFFLTKRIIQKADFILDIIFADVNLALKLVKKKHILLWKTLNIALKAYRKVTELTVPLFLFAQIIDMIIQ